jgi:HD superfamily phosphodiesterase
MARNMIHQYVKNLTSDRMVSGYSHCYRVYHMARELDTKYDDDVLYAACFLHDVVAGSDDLEIISQSADKAEQLLHEVGFPPEKISLVLECIKSHWPGQNPTIKEAQLLHDANLLDSLGAIGVLRLSIGSFFWYHHKTLKQVLELIKSFREKSKYLILPKAQKMAKIKIDFMDDCIKELEKEEHL